MPSVSPQLFTTIYGVSRWLFAFIALFMLFVAFSWLHSERKKHRARFRSLPGAGTIGEMVVLSGSDQLPVNTWFPVPREGVLGSLRTCDLVVPCPGVRSHHLDFVWLDGTGLILRPRSGCDTRINGVPVCNASEAGSMPLVHGSTLQVGSAVLRLQVFAALDNTARAESFGEPLGAAASVPYPGAAADLPPYPQGEPAASPPYFPEQAQDLQPAVPQPYPNPVAPSYVPGETYAPEQAFAPETQDPAASAASEQTESVQPSAPPRRRRADRWKEDWSE